MEYLRWKKRWFIEDFIDLSSQYDFLLLQEANLGQELEEVLLTTQRGWEHATSFKWGKTKMGVATGSEVEPQFARRVVSVHREVGFTTKKTSLLSIYSLDNKQNDLLILNMHAINFRGIAAFKDEINQVYQIIKEHQGPIIWAGDFNTWTQARLDYLNSKAGKLNLMQVDFKAGRTTAPIGKGLVLDRVYYREMKVNNAEVLEQIQSSDHIPLSIEFTLK